MKAGNLTIETELEVYWIQF